MARVHNPAIAYRPEIDGLRAVAVLPVILFHAGFEAFSGGFLGVDVFFVISGYLITSIICRELESGTFSIARFYERRARRILPALFFVLLCCLPAAWWWMLPDAFRRFGQSLVAVATFSSNFHFWTETDYFAPAAEAQPLLHTWSLAVEEQYYLLFPWFLVLCRRLGASRLLWLTAALALASLALSEWGWRHLPVTSFYLLPTRAWELLAGSLLALLPRATSRPAQPGRWASEAGSLAGFGLVVASLLCLDERTPAPSLYTLLPVAGTALVLGMARPENVVSRLLSSRPLAAIGLVSYSAYLWHQPLFAFARLSSVGKPAPRLMIALAVASIVLAAITWRCVEEPFRRTRRGTRTVLGRAGAGSLIVICLGLVIHGTDGFAGRLNTPEGVAMTIAREDARCFNAPGAHERAEWLCPIGSGAPPPYDFLLLGDSHMLSMIPGVDRVARQAGLAGGYVGYSGCPPFLGVHALRRDQATQNCHRLNRRVYEYVRDHEIRSVILVARWTYYTEGGYDADNFSFLGSSPEEKATPASSFNAWSRGLEETVRAYAALGVVVNLIAQAPQQRLDPTAIYHEVFSADVEEDRRRRLQRLSVSRSDHEALQGRVAAEFARQQASFPDNLRLIDPGRVLCSEDVCPVGSLVESYYFDDDHLSITGAHRLMGALASDLAFEP